MRTLSLLRMSDTDFCQDDTARLRELPEPHPRPAADLVLTPVAQRAFECAAPSRNWRTARRGQPIEAPARVVSVGHDELLPLGFDASVSRPNFVNEDDARWFSLAFRAPDIWITPDVIGLVSHYVHAVKCLCTALVVEPKVLTAC